MYVQDHRELELVVDHAKKCRKRVETLKQPKQYNTTAKDMSQQQQHQEAESTG